MLLKTYDKVVELFEANGGYLHFEHLKEAGLSTLQIHELVERGNMVRFSRGWYYDPKMEKPRHYKMIELGMVNKNAVVCAESACYYWGLVEKEPLKLSFATNRTDRSKSKLDFPVYRHYYSNYGYSTDIVEIQTNYVPIHVYGMDKSIVDAIRCREAIGDETLAEIITKYRQRPERNEEAMMEYAEQVRLKRVVMEILKY